MNTLSTSRRSTTPYTRRSMSRDVTPRRIGGVGSTFREMRASIGPQPRRTPQPTAPSKTTQSSKPQCENTECANSDVVEDEGTLICRTCGFILQESQITQELTFGEAANGAAVVQGVYVGANDETARSSGNFGPRFGGGMTSRQISERNAAAEMNKVVNRLNLGIADKDRGMQVYKLAMAANMVQGRTIREVAGACLYVGCRRDPECQVMLIDFSEILEVNVFKLGELYKTIVNKLALNEGGGVPLYEANPETLIQRFARDLEFGNDEHRIVREAIQILKRMKRDWITVGRRPAGVCGAALILAARMNNYRRTVREVVYTAKVADITINKRLDEFQFTESSKLTVDEFRHHGLALEKEHDPPAFYEQFDPRKKRSKRKRGVKRPETDSEIVSVRSSVSPSQEPSASPRSSAQSEQPESLNISAREEADRRAMPPPSLPIDPQLLSQSAEVTPQSELPLHGTVDASSEEAPAAKKRKIGRPAGVKNKPLPQKTSKAIQDEEQIEADMEAILQDPQAVEEAAVYHRSITGQPTPPTTQEGTTRPSAEQEQIPSIEQQASSIPSSEIIDEAEFDEDPEVYDCLLSPEERAIKEQVWVTENAEWLLKLQARQIKKELAERSGTAHQPQKRVRRRARMGDMSQYQVVREDGSVGTPSSAEEATRMMLEKRMYSKKINYDAIKHLYSRENTGSSPSMDGDSRASSVHRSPAPISILAPGPSGVRKSTKGAVPKSKAARVAEAKKTIVQKAIEPQAKTKAAATSKKQAAEPKERKQKGEGQNTDEYAVERSELDDIAKEGRPSSEEEEESDQSDVSDNSDWDEDDGEKEKTASQKQEMRKAMYGSTEDEESDYGDEI